MEGINGQETIYLADNIRCLRRRMNLSQEELAGKVFLNRGNIASYENGTAEPKICNLIKFSTLFEVSMVDLIQRDLSNEEEYADASSNYQTLTQQERSLLEQFSSKAQEIEGVLRSFHTFHCFRMKNVEDMPRDMQMLVMHFEELLELSLLMQRQYVELLGFIKCRIKSC